MSEKYLKEIAKELKLIRKELQKNNTPRVIKTGEVSKEEFEKMLNGRPVILGEE